MNILLSLNKKFFLGTRVLIHSIMKNDKEIIFYILYTDLESQDVTILTHDIEDNGGQVFFYKINYETCRFSECIEFECYLRLYMLYVLPETLDKILYLDTDMVVLKSLQVMYDMNLGNNYCAACEDLGILTFSQARKELYSNIGFSNEAHYFNSGLMLLNLKLIRKDFQKDAFIRYAQDNKSKEYRDQDVLNILFSGKILWLTREYNLCPLDIHPKIFDYFVDRVYILHYVTYKPWSNNYYQINDSVWWKEAIEIGYRKQYIAHKLSCMCFAMYQPLREFYAKMKKCFSRNYLFYKI